MTGFWQRNGLPRATSTAVAFLIAHRPFSAVILSLKAATFRSLSDLLNTAAPMQIQERRRNQEVLLEKLNQLAAQTATIKVRSCLAECME